MSQGHGLRCQASDVDCHVTLPRGHSHAMGTIPRFDRAVCGYFTLGFSAGLLAGLFSKVRLRRRFVFMWRHLVGIDAHHQIGNVIVDLREPVPVPAGMMTTSPAFS
jgi:hypothetical protein